MNTRLATLIATIAVIGIVAVGAGYAYTALSINEGNNASAQYATLTQTAYTFTNVAVVDEFDSLTDSTHGPGKTNNAGYKLTSPDDLGVSGYTLKQVGTVDLHANVQGYTLQTAPTLKLGIDNTNVSGFTAGTSITYWLVSGTSVVGKLSSNNTWTAADGTTFGINFTKDNNGTAGNFYNDITLKLCVGYDSDDATWAKLNSNYVLETPTGNITSGQIVFSATVVA